MNKPNYFRTRVNLGLSYIGGKHRQAIFMEQFFPESFDSMNEAFGGGFKNSSRMMRRQAARLGYNDLSLPMANLMKALQQPKTFAKVIRKLFSRAEYLRPPVPFSPENRPLLEEHYKEVHRKWCEFFRSAIQNQVNIGQEELARVDWLFAGMFLFCLKHSRNGIPCKASFKFSKKGSLFHTIQFIYHLQKHGKAIQKFMRKVKFYNQDGKMFLLSQDAVNVFHLIDPPYYEHEYLYDGGNYRKPKMIDLIRFVRLCHLVKNLKGKFMFCHYYHPLLEHFFPRDQYQWIFKSYPRGSKGKSKEPGIEIIILNYQVDQSLLKSHLKAEAEIRQPEPIGRGRRYEFEFKRSVLLMLESGLYTRKEIMALTKIRSYSTLKRWEENRAGIFDSLYYVERAKLARTKKDRATLKEALETLKNHCRMTNREICKRVGMTVYGIRKALQWTALKKKKQALPVRPMRESVQNPKRRWVSGSLFVPHQMAA